MAKIIQPRTRRPVRNQPAPVRQAPAADATRRSC